MKISVFGSAKPQPSEQAYVEAYLLGQILGSEGHTVITGGYCGTMEAVSRGAFESGAPVIGVTCDEVESWRATGANEWVKEEWRTERLTDRITAMITNSDATIALPGGIGTLTEIMLTWNNLAIHAIPQIPLILIGKGWKEVFSVLMREQESQLNQLDMDKLAFCPSVEAASAHLHGLMVE